MSKTVLVTGASAGIGAALARTYAREGWDVALAARREAPMLALKSEIEGMGRRAEVFIADLFKPDTPAALVADVEARMGTVDGLVNNAGYGHPDRYLDSAWEDHAKFLQLMLTAPSELAHLVAKGMVERGFGHIINVASLAGHMPGSRGHTLYAAVKSYLIKFSESLNAELAEAGVHVSALCPGFTYTEFHDVNGTRGQVSKMPEWMFQSAEDVAEEAFHAITKNKAVHITGRVNRGLAMLPRLLPASVARKAMSSNSEKFRKG